MNHRNWPRIKAKNTKLCVMFSPRFWRFQTILKNLLIWNRYGHGRTGRTSAAGPDWCPYFKPLVLFLLTFRNLASFWSLVQGTLVLLSFSYAGRVLSISISCEVLAAVQTGEDAASPTLLLVVLFHLILAYGLSACITSEGNHDLMKSGTSVQQMYSTIILIWMVWNYINVYFYWLCGKAATTTTDTSAKEPSHNKLLHSVH